MAMGRFCGTADEGKQVDIEHLVQRGRELQSKTVYETFAKVAVKVTGCLGMGLCSPSGCAQKLKKG